jgi:glutamate/tyrosine decarboxylase-like PLP-dependent enzyme
MDLIDFATKNLSRLDPGLVSVLERWMRKVPAVSREIESQYDTLLGGIEADLKPYRKDFTTYSRLPETGRDREEILDEVAALKAVEEGRWKDGFVSGAVYHGDEGHIDFLNQVYALHSQSNPLHADIWPSASKFEAEIVSMTAAMLGATTDGDGVGGTVTSGGTESILLAMKAYRDWGREKKGITHPEMVVPVTAHAAFEKAAQYFKIRMVRIPVDGAFRADVRAARRAINRNTVVVVGSAPAFPHGSLDPIPELSALALEHGVGFHTDACLGGFVLPWAERLGYPVPPFDFRLPGVTSMSADTHKYGYAAKGTSVVLYRGAELRRSQYFATPDWPGGLYFSPTFAGSRPGALSAACWAAMVSMGEQGYLEAARKILETGAAIRKGIEAIPGLRVLGEPLWVIAFASDEVDIYRVLDTMIARKWSLNGLHRPAAVHIAVTLRHTQPGVVERFLADLCAAVEHVRQNPSEQGGMAPVYGMAGTMPLRGVVSEMLRRYIDLMYKV